MRNVCCCVKSIVASISKLLYKKMTTYYRLQHAADMQ